MRWRLILEEFGPDIQHISGEMNIVADAMSRLPTTNQDQKEQCTDARGLASKELEQMEVFILSDEEYFPLELSLVQEIHNIELNKRQSQLKKTLKNNKSNYHFLVLDGFKLVAFKGKIYVPVALRHRTMNW